MIKTYQDLIAVGDNELNRMAFVKSAISNHKDSEKYKTARNAELYDRHQNVTINNFRKLVYKVTGEAIEDVWSSNYKMSCRHYNRFVTQEIQHLLGNGVTWNNEATADKLGTKRKPFDNQLQKLAKKARTGGEAFGFYNLDHIDVFGLTEFVPLYDEENGSLRAGIRFWQISANKPLRATLYEENGYTEYMWYGNSNNFKPSESWRVIDNDKAVKEKRMYKLNIQQSEADGVEIVNGENYKGFPIVPLFANDEHLSTLIGLREQIDAYDLIKSGFANTVDDASMIYWTLQGAGGMDDVDLQEFVEKIKTLKAVNLPPDVSAQANTVNLPYQASEALLDRLDKDLYRDAMALDVDRIANGAVTATQIKASYESLDAKCDAFEFCVLDFIYGILELAGVDDEATFTRSMIVNTTEEIQVTIQSAPFMAEDDVTRRIYELMGMKDRVEDALNNIEADNYQRFDRTEEAVN